MNVRFTGASLAIISMGLLAAAGVRKKRGAKNELGELAGFDKIDLGDRPGWILRERGDDQVVFTSDEGKWIVVSRNKRRPESLILRWEGGRDQQEAAREAQRKFAGLLELSAERRRPTAGPAISEKKKRTWKLVFDSREEALEAYAEDQEAMRLLEVSLDADEAADRFEAHVSAEPDGGYAYTYQAVHPHPGSVIVMAGSGNSLSDEEKKIRQAADSAGLMNFNEWVKVVAKIRGRPLSEADPYRPAIEASEGETWYDVWLDKVPPDEAAKLGSRSVR